MKEWYLIRDNTRPNMLGGFENQAFLDYKDDAFFEALQTDIADTVLLCNHDLTKQKKIRAIIQGNTADTQLKSMERSILVPINTLKSGDYIFFEDEYWIVDGRPGNNHTYEKAMLKECQYKLRWQRNDGCIIERWANLTSASKYDVGENKGKNIILTSNNFTIVIPEDKDGLTIDGQRVFIDISRIPKKVFKITRSDDVLFYHNRHGGTLSLIADKAEFNSDTDRPDLRVCDYIDINHSCNSSDNEQFEIIGNNEIKVGISRIYYAKIINKTADELKWDDNKYSWNVICDFDISIEINGPKIRLSISDESMINKTFLLQLKDNNDTIVAEKGITVVDVI